MSDSNSYNISLPQFEGPFDLLLFFIERDELNIQDIPIHQITQDFLDYIHSLEQMNIEVASEFILVAATLMRIKTKMLIPRKELNEKGDEIDPRKELVQKILEYKQFKDVLEILKTMEDKRMQHFSRGTIKNELKEIIENYSLENDLEQISLFKLYKSFYKVIEKYSDRKLKVEHKVVPYLYTVEEEKTKLLTLLDLKNHCTFDELFVECKTKIHAVFIFLSMLELIQQQQISIQIRDGYNNILLSKNSI
ncbi:MAG: segregation/condensation protein A [Chitinophagales bacterium]|nr:segregation/condensation protein A [Chitinophagales bacterium]